MAASAVWRRTVLMVSVAILALTACSRSSAAADEGTGEDGAKAADAPKAAAAAKPADLRGYWIGALAPEITLEKEVQGPPGGFPSIDQLRGKTVVLAFWSTDCPSCPVVLPHLNALVDHFAGKPVVFLSVINKSEDEVRAFLKTTPVKTWIGCDYDISMTEKYFIMGVPMIAIVNPQGVLCAKSHPLNVTVEAIETAMEGRTPILAMPPVPEQLLKEPAPTQLPILELAIRPCDMTTARDVKRVGGLRMHGVTVREILSNAYIHNQMFVESPDILLDAKYDVNVVPPAGRESEASEMLKRLIEESLGLTAHVEERTVPVYVLTAPNGAGPALRKPSDEAHPDVKYDETGGVLDLTKAPVQALAFYIFSAMRCERPVIDETGLTDAYDIRLTWNPTDPLKAVPFAVAQQLGLKMTEEQRPEKVLVVERAK